jgi:hypothetical protein
MAPWVERHGLAWHRKLQQVTTSWKHGALPMAPSNVQEVGLWFFFTNLVQFMLQFQKRDNSSHFLLSITWITFSMQRISHGETKKKKNEMHLSTKGPICRPSYCIRPAANPGRVCWASLCPFSFFFSFLLLLFLCFSKIVFYKLNIS